MTYNTPRFRPDTAIETPFRDVVVGDTLVVATPWWAPAPGYEVWPVTRVQQTLVEIRDGRMTAVRGFITDSGRTGTDGCYRPGIPGTATQLAAAEERITRTGGLAAVGLRVWWRTGSGYETFADVPPSRTAVIAMRAGQLPQPAAAEVAA